ncbi:MAG TPA: ABC transporter ATP-binding protein [Candidatus Omnitrophota bacterium]|nr:ABC transporter ATP-binding protein [Candidatus Omnitrophota bacterium]
MKTKSGKKVNTKENFLEYLSYLKNYKWLIFIIIFVTLLNEMKSVADRYIFKMIIDNGTNFTAGSLLLADFVKILSAIALVYAGLILVNTFLVWTRVHLANRLNAYTIYDLKQKYFWHILGLDYNFHTTHKTGSLISRLGRGASAMDRMGDSIIFQFGPLVLESIIATVAFFYLDRIIALIVLIIMIVFVSFSYIMQKKSEDSNVLLNKIEDTEKGNTADFFTNIDSIRHYGKEDYIRERYEKLSEKTKKSQIFNWDYFRTISSGQSLILSLGTFALFYFSIKGFLAGQVTLGTLAFVYTTYLALIGPMFGFVNGIRDFSRSMADFQELFEYGKFRNEIKDSPNAEKLRIEKGEIEFKNLSFNYGKRKIFSDFNLKINPGERVALVGHSGSGKTTLIKLLYRLYNLDSGKILIDGKDIKDFKQTSLRSELSIVPQECILFDDTVFNNIKFSKPDASDEEVMNAIKFAQLDKVIKNFPKKEDTVVGERGIKLSGGEKQRVSIARAILANKKILVLDEATSSLDSETEHEIQKDLKKLLEGRTAIMIAHRLSTIMNADKIVVMKNGKIIQIGKHKDLIAREGEYSKLWNLQKGGYIEE